MTPTKVNPETPSFMDSAKRRQAAIDLAEDIFTDEEIAERAGVNRETLHNWKKRVDFCEVMAQRVAELEVTAVSFALARRRERIRKLQEHADRLEQLMEARRAKFASELEGATGMVAERSLAGKLGVIGSDFYFDDKLSREYRETLNQIARERGQLNEKIEITSETMTRRYEGVNVDAV